MLESRQVNFWFRRVFQKSGGEKPRNASVIGELYKTECGTPFDSPVIPFATEFSSPITTKDKSRHHQFGTNVLPGIFILCVR